MKIHGREITDSDMKEIAGYMENTIREKLHRQIAPCKPEKFLKEYIKKDPNIIPILKNEFRFEI